MSKINLSMLACIIVAASLFGCKSKFEADADHPLVVAYTSGVISIQSPVRIALTDDAMKTAPQAGDPVADGTLKFSPSVAGKTVWVNTTTIEFVPDKLFEARHGKMK